MPINVVAGGTPQRVRDVAPGSIFYLPLYKERRLVLKARNSTEPPLKDFLVWLDQDPAKNVPQFELSESDAFENEQALVLDDVMLLPGLDDIEAKDDHYREGDVLLEGGHAAIYCKANIKFKTFVSLETGLFRRPDLNAAGIKVRSWRLVRPVQGTIPIQYDELCKHAS